MPTSQDDFKIDALEDRLRVLVEHCDCLQGCLTAGDLDWSWATLSYLQLFADFCPKLPALLLSFNSVEGGDEEKNTAEYLVGLSDFSHLLHIPSLWRDHHDPLQRYSPAIITDNISFPFRASPVPDMSTALEPLLLNAHSNLATSLCNISADDQLFLGIEPTVCSQVQRLYRGRGHEVTYGVPSVAGWDREVTEYETVSARTTAFAAWLLAMNHSVRRRHRDDDTLETANRLLAIAEYYSDQ